MDFIVNTLLKLGIGRDDLDYHFIRGSMVIIYLFFGYQKWFGYEAQALIPYISHGPLIFWMYPVFGIRGATYFRCGVDIRRTPVRRILEQKIGNPWRPRFVFFHDIDCNNPCPSP
jgi:uncharacterized membrane protein YkgB